MTDIWIEMAIVAYLGFAALGVIGLVRWWRGGDWDWFGGRSVWREGLDVSLCFIIFNSLLALIPLVALVHNFFWIHRWWNQKRRGRPLPWPCIKLPGIKLPKCPIVFKREHSAPTGDK